MKNLGIGVLLVEQNAKQSLAIADRGYLLENTRITYEDKAARLAKDPAVQKAYLGAGSKTLANLKSPPEASTAVPTKVTTLSNPTPRRSAEEQIGGSIDELVAAAAKTSVSNTKQSSNDTVAAADRHAQSRIEVVLKDIETAAVAARRKRSIKTLAQAQKASKPRRQIADAPPPIIEVYKRPRVEVYRRRPSGQFERD